MSFWLKILNFYLKSPFANKPSNPLTLFMKPIIHPTFASVSVTCACGNTFQTGSTAKEIRTEICSQCHPFYTGKQKLLDAAGNVDKFKKRTAAATNIKSAVKPKKERKTRTKK